MDVAVSAEGAEARAAAVGRRCVLAAAVLWSLSGVVAKGLDLPPLAIAFYRSLFAGLAMWPFVPPARRVFRPIMIATVLIFGAMIGLYIAAIKITSAANAIFLQCSAGFWLIPLSILFLRERPDRRSTIGIGLATVGIAAIVLRGYKPGEGLGVLMGLASGVCFALTIITLRGLRDVDPIWLSLVNNLGGSLALGAWMLATGDDHSFAVGSATNLAILAGFGVIQMAIPYALFAKGLRTLGAPEAGLIGLLEPVLNPTWVYLVHGERPLPATIFGGACLLAGVAIRYLPAPRIRSVPTDPPA